MSKLQLILDVECYPDYFLVMLGNEGIKPLAFEMFDGHPLDKAGLLRYLLNPKVEILTFNGNFYDLAMVRYAIKDGTTNSMLKKLSDYIITSEDKLMPWDLEKRYELPTLDADHIDIKALPIGQQSLKIYAGRLHCKRMQDMPIEPDQRICDDTPVVIDGVTYDTPEAKREQVRLYCANDLSSTKLVADALEEQIELRRVMSEDYGVDLRSKSDAQIAEAVLKSEITKATGITPKKQRINYDRFNYVPPAHVKFITPYMQERLEIIKAAEMTISDSGHVQEPKIISDMVLEIAGKSYKIGIGGLHSQESCVSHYANEEYFIRDIDVVSYYPQMILNMGMYPPALGADFLRIYQVILDERVSAKRAGLKVKANSLKITLNGTFGKTSSRYSILYNPKMMLSTTLTGQLNLLMLIEALEYKGISVISANTDGIVVYCKRDKEDLLKRIVKAWERTTNLETEEANYKSLHNRDVNNYIAIKTNGEVKLKGVYAPSGLAKSPQGEICAEAVVAYLKDGIPVDKTICESRDIRKFVHVRKVDGGAVKEGYFLGKAIRWYYATGVEDAIYYKTSGNKVAGTDGAKPCLELPDEFPQDVNLEWYILEAKEILRGMGAVKLPDLPKLPRRNTKKWMAEFEAGNIVMDHKGNYVWKEMLK